MLYENIIVIPYRNRKEHLTYFIKTTLPLLQECLPNSKIVVVEQNDGKLFNRGALLNVGFKEYENKTKYFFTQDVDVNPTKKCIEEFYIQTIDEEHVLGIYTSSTNTLGGIIKITDSVIQKINGFPNDIWGWGTEDKALQNRAEYFNINKIENLTNIQPWHEYIIRFDNIDDRNRKNIAYNSEKHFTKFNQLNHDQKMKDIMSSGLNNLEYTILKRRTISKTLEFIKVEI